MPKAAPEPSESQEMPLQQVPKPKSKNPVGDKLRAALERRGIFAKPFMPRRRVKGS